MKKLLLAFMLLFAATPAIAGEKSDYYVVYFTSQGCAPCEQFQRETLPHKNVKKTLSEFKHHNGKNIFIYDVYKANKLAKRYEIEATPTVVIIEVATGKAVKRAVGFMTPSEFVKFLKAPVKVRAGPVETQFFGAAITLKGIIILFAKLLFFLIG
tara:strand:+ start:117 stop:581 length:465 start_codon:yes stop_codon:yes gene_type:complete